MSSSSGGKLHVIGRFDDPHTGAEKEMHDIRTVIAGRRDVQLWSDVQPHRYHADKGVRWIQPFAGQSPKDGVLLVAGVHVSLGIWLKYARFERVILLYNLASHDRLFATIEALRDLTRCEPEVVFVSLALQLSVNLPGRIINSLIDLQPFLAPPSAPSVARPFTVGRHSRDVPGKHHPQDPSLYRMLAANGIRVRIMGGTCLADQLEGVDGIELLPVGAESSADFCRSLDAFFYRTGGFAEAYGRVVIEAMASGLPVVAGFIGGYADFIRPGLTGVLVRSQEEAFDALMALANAGSSITTQIGLAARSDAVSRHGPQANEALIQSWLLD